MLDGPGRASLHVLTALAHRVQEPDPLLSLIQHLLEEVARGRVAVLIAHRDRRPLTLGEVSIVRQEPADHLLRKHEVLVVVFERLQFGDVRDAPYRRATDPSHSLRQDIDRAEDRVGLLVEQQMIIAEVRAGHVPVKVLRLDVQGKRVRDQAVDGLRDRPNFLRLQVGWGRQLPRSEKRLDRTLGVCHGRFSFSVSASRRPSPTTRPVSHRHVFHRRPCARRDSEKQRAGEPKPVPTNHRRRVTMTRSARFSLPAFTSSTTTKSPGLTSESPIGTSLKARWRSAGGCWGWAMSTLAPWWGGGGGYGYY